MSKNRAKNMYILLWLLCVLGSLALFPYVYYLQIIPSESSWLKLLLLGILQSSVFFGLICWLSSKIVPKTDLKPFADRFSVKQVVYPGLIWGISVGLVCFFLAHIVFASSALAQRGISPPAWTGALASLLFGIGHLPAAFRILGSLSLFEVARILLLNGIPGIVLGWLYWSRGLWAAIFTHFVLDWMVHVFSRFIV